MIMSNLHKIGSYLFNAFYYCLYKNISKNKWPKIISMQFYILKRRRLNWDNPKSYDEKVQWLKLYDDSELRTKLTDKYAVREWVANTIGEEYLIPLLGRWDRPEDIEYSSLPAQFVLKANHGCGCNYIVTDKATIDRKDISKKFKKWMKINYAYLCGERQYEKIKPCIIAEEYIADLDGEIPDYKVWCFNGKAYYIMYLCERNKGLKMAFYDRDWNKQNFVYSYPRYEKEVERPQCLDKLIYLSEKLAANFYHVRVDFYVLKNGDIKFGEMTFTSAGGKSKWSPKDADFNLGNLLHLPTDN